VPCLVSAPRAGTARSARAASRGAPSVFEHPRVERSASPSGGRCTDPPASRDGRVGGHLAPLGGGDAREAPRRSTRDGTSGGAGVAARLKREGRATPRPPGHKTVTGLAATGRADSDRRARKRASGTHAQPQKHGVAFLSTICRHALEINPGPGGSSGRSEGRARTYPRATRPPRATARPGAGRKPPGDGARHASGRSKTRPGRWIAIPRIPRIPHGGTDAGRALSRRRAAAAPRRARGRDAAAERRPARPGDEKRTR
jgi:hypothetical protein